MAEHPMDTMDTEFCGSEFWNANTTWYTDYPDFTYCFERTVLVWTPCAVLWAFSVLDIFYIKKSMNPNVHWNWLNVTKLIGTGALILLTVIDLCMAASRNSEEIIFPVDVYTLVIKIVSFVLAVILLVCNKRNGLLTSGLLFLFWFLLVVFSIPQIRSEKGRRAEKEAAGEKNSWAEYNYVSFMIFFALTTLVRLLNWFADGEPLQTKYPKTQNPCPETQSSFISKMFVEKGTFSWGEEETMKFDPALVRVRVFSKIPTKQPKDKILANLAQMNRDINTESWQIKRIRPMGSNSIVYMRIDMKSFETITKRGGSVNWILGPIDIRKEEHKSRGKIQTPGAVQSVETKNSKSRDNHFKPPSDRSVDTTPRGLTGLTRNGGSEPEGLNWLSHTAKKDGPATPKEKYKVA